MGAPIAIAVEALDATLKEAVNNSKIMNTLDKEISKALGLLVDLILLPFLPILVGGIIQLYMAVLAFGKWWNDVTSVLKKEGLLGLIKLSIDAGINWAEEFIGSILKFLFGTGEEKKANVKTIDAIINFLKPIFGIPLLEGILKFLFGERPVLPTITASVLVGFGKLLTLHESILNFIFGITKTGVKDLFTFLVSIPLNLAGLMLKIMEYVFGINTTVAQNKITTYFELLKANPLDTAWQALTAGAGGFIKSALSLVGMAEGGPVRGGQSYLVGEKGPEMFTPSSSGTISPNSGGNTFNFYGLTHEELPEKVRSILRQEGSRYTL